MLTEKTRTVNPFEEILSELSAIKNQLSTIQNASGQPKQNRKVNFKEFCKYVGIKESTAYIKISKGYKFPGAFKMPGSSKWLFDLDLFDTALQKLASSK